MTLPNMNTESFGMKRLFQFSINELHNYSISDCSFMTAAFSIPRTVASKYLVQKSTFTAFPRRSSTFNQKKKKKKQFDYIVSE